jgi:hypothetical protein
MRTRNAWSAGTALAIAVAMTPASAINSEKDLKAGMSSDLPGLRSASYDGKWSGTVKCLYDPGLWPEDECDIGLTLDIRDHELSVRQTVRNRNGKETTSEINPGQFRLYRLATNAIAASMESGKDDDGTWVETWNFVMTLTDANHMLVHWTRVVNNLDMPKDKKGSKFSSVGMGQLQRQL